MAIKLPNIKKEVLDDLASRFVINIPDEDKDDVMMLCSWIEPAHWFYLDFLRPDDPSLPACSLKEFMASMFNHCPFLIPDGYSMKDIARLADQWKTHKYKKPVRGAIILNESMTKCLLVQGYPASTSWGFPKGKIEVGEDDVDAAIREVYEETGLDIRQLIKQDHFIESIQGDHQARMYIICGVSENIMFEPKARKEIKDIQWFSISDLPTHRKDVAPKSNLGISTNKFFLIIPFMGPIKKWIASQRQKNFKPVTRQVPPVGPISSLADSSRPLHFHSQPATGLSAPAHTGPLPQVLAQHQSYSASLAQLSLAEQQPPWSMPQPLVRDSNARVQYPQHLGFGPHHTVSLYQEWPGPTIQSQPTAAFTHIYSLLTPASAFVNFSLDKDSIVRALLETK